jgi:hypothetical protein
MEDRVIDCPSNTEMVVEVAEEEEEEFQAEILK